jgi:transcriptional regulator with XRE-family HTH domain
MWTKSTFVNTDLYRVQMNAVQMRMARAAIGWGVRELAERAGVTANTITRIENGSDAKASTLASIRGALEAAGIVFLADGELADGGPGVRLARR